MEEKKERVVEDTTKWQSTYGILTSERLLAEFDIKLDKKALLELTNYPNSFIFQLLRIPMHNVFNGIINQQALDYQIYAQKIFIDYLISGKADDPPEAQGSSTRERLEDERNNLLSISESFNDHTKEHMKLIGKSQKDFISLCAELNKKKKQCAKILKKSPMFIDSLLVYLTADSVTNEFCEQHASVIGNVDKDLLAREISPILKYKEEIKNLINKYMSSVETNMASSKAFRSQFYELILNATKLVKQLPDYREDEQRKSDNLSELNFDTNIGEA